MITQDTERQVPHNNRELQTSKVENGLCGTEKSGSVGSAKISQYDQKGMFTAGNRRKRTAFQLENLE